MSGSNQPTEEEIREETLKFHSRETSKIKENEFVHDVYNEIAQHFSQTRYKPWPIVSKFLSSRSKNSIGLDVGCGNGKYIAINPEIFIIGSDYSTGLINQAKDLHKNEPNNDIFVADGMNLPHNSGDFDFAISIAVIHHFADKERRIDAIREILRVLKPGAQALIYCWALEQEKSRRGYKEGMEQDILVPWVLTQKQEKKKKEPRRRHRREEGQQTQQPQQRDEVKVAGREGEGEGEGEKCLREELQDLSLSGEDKKPEVKMRFYHLYKKGELVEDAVAAGGKLVEEGYERDNWWVIVQKI